MARRLEVRLLHYFLLIAFAAVLIGVEFYFEMNRADLWHGICADFGIAGEALNPQALQQLRDKVVIMFGVLTAVVAIVLMMFIKNITLPLRRMLDVVNKINEGDLSQEVAVESKDEIGQVGQTINDLVSNLQEVAAFTSSTTRDIETKLDGLAARVETEPDSARDDIREIKNDLASLRDFLDSFTLR